MSMVLEESLKVSPPTDANIRVIAVTNASQVVPLAEYATAALPTGQMFLTFQADGCDLYLCFTSNASASVAAATTSAPGSAPVGNSVPGIKIPNGTSLTVHHTASLSAYVAVVGSAAGYMRYWRASRVGAS